MLVTYQDLGSIVMSRKAIQDAEITGQFISRSEGTDSDRNKLPSNSFSVHVSFIVKESSSKMSRTLVFESEDLAMKAYDTLEPLSRQHHFNLENSAIADRPKFAASDAASPSTSGNPDVQAALLRHRIRSNSMEEFLDDEEDDMQLQQPPSDADFYKASSAASQSSSLPSSSPSSSSSSSSSSCRKPQYSRNAYEARSKQLSRMFLAPQLPPLTDLVMFETKRWIYIFGCSVDEVLKGHDNRSGVSDEVMIPFLDDTSSDYARNKHSASAKSGANWDSGNTLKYHLMKISRRDDSLDTRPQALEDIIVFDSHVYNGREVQTLIKTLKLVATGEGDNLVGPISAVAIVGFVRFLRGFYLVLASERCLLGKIGGHAVFSIRSSQVIQVWQTKKAPESKSLLEKLQKGISRQFSGKSPLDAAESKYLAMFSLVDLTKDFYFSYTYALTHTVQTNLEAANSVRGRRNSDRIYQGQRLNTVSSSGPGNEDKLAADYSLKVNDRFVWNHHLTSELLALKELSVGGQPPINWSIVLLHGSFSQRECMVFGKRINITLIARRSRHFAGTRYLKRGVTEDGKVANDVEIEQIVETIDTCRITSHVQVRGSIPVFWTQETSATNPKPPIIVQRQDPTFEAATRHFSDLFERYGEPIVVLDLVRSAENEGPRNRRESLVGDLNRLAVKEINKQLPPEVRIRYKPLDFKAMSKHTDSKGKFVFDWLFALAEEALQLHGFCAYQADQELPESNGSRISSSKVMKIPQHLEELFNPMWYHFGTCTTKKSEDLLKGRRVGTFLLREDGNGIHVISYVTSTLKIEHVALYQHPRTMQYRLPNGHLVSTLHEVIFNFGTGQQQELCTGLKYTGASQSPKEQSLDVFFRKAAKARVKSRQNDVTTLLARNSRNVREMADLARKLQQPSLYNDLVRDRRYRMRIYMRCFKANELIDVMILHGFCKSRSDGIILGLKLQKYGHLHHVLDEHEFQDAKLFFRWFNDEANILGRYFKSDNAGSEKSKTMQQTSRIQEGIFTSLHIDYIALAKNMKKDLIVRDRSYRGKVYQHCFIARDAVAWLSDWITLNRKKAGHATDCTSGKNALKSEAVALGRALVTAGMFVNVTGSQTFSDGTLLYRFSTKEHLADAGDPNLLFSHQNTSVFSNSSLSKRPVTLDAFKEYGSARQFLKQRGVVRSNCIDCLDRTNVAQWCIGMRMLACQLYVLGIDLCLEQTSRVTYLERQTTAGLVLTPKSKVAQIITQMWETLGDRIALQYGGSEAHKKVTGQPVLSEGKAGKKNKRKTAEVITSIRRYYSNSFTDRVKQDAMNLFLGKFQPLSIHQEIEELEFVMKSRTSEDTLPSSTKLMRKRTASRNKLFTRSGQGLEDGSSSACFIFDFQHLWELEGESLPSDYYLHNKNTMRDRRVGSLDCILDAISVPSIQLNNDQDQMNVSNATPSTPMDPKPFTCLHELPYFRQSDDRRMKHDWWSLSLSKFLNKGDSELCALIPFNKKNRETNDIQLNSPSERTENVFMTSFDSLQISSSTNENMPRLLELEIDLVDHSGNMDIDRVHDYESLKLAPREFGLPVDAYSALSEMRHAHGLVKHPGFKALGIYHGGDIDISARGTRPDLLAEAPIVWQHRQRKGDRSKQGATSNCQIHLLQQFWKVPTFVSAGLASAPKKDRKTCPYGAEKNNSLATKEAAKNEKSIENASDASSRLKYSNSRSSVFHVLDSVFRIRASDKDIKPKVKLQSQISETKANENGERDLDDLGDRLNVELPIVSESIRAYQEYVALGQNSWHDGLRAEEALFEELRSYESGMPNKRILEIFRHAKYLQVDPYDLEALRMVQSAGGATHVIKHGAFRGLHQDSPAVETKAALDSLLWNFETSDRTAFSDSMKVDNNVSMHYR